ncbi:hypothetical protein HYV12_02440 [Candidatus Dojkabacteria bacterium]|nr:hypothetical protein [Candidatus Dojkabacteria bacterium]
MEISEIERQARFEVDDIIANAEGTTYLIFGVEDDKYTMNAVMKDSYDNPAGQWVAAPTPVDADADGYTRKPIKEVDESFELVEA